MFDRIKIRVTNSYRGTESALYGGRRVPEGAVLLVEGPRAREIIAAGNGVPVVGPAEQKNAAPGSIASEVAATKKGSRATAGKGAPPSSSLPVPASPATTAPRPRDESPSKAGKP